MNWFVTTVIWQFVLTIVPCIIIVGIFRALNKKHDNEVVEEEK